MRYAERLVGEPADAEDIVESVFARLCEHASEVGEGEVLLGKVIRAVRNGAIDRWRRQRTRRRALEGRTVAAGASTVPSPAVEVERRMLAEKLERSISSLPPRCREAFCLRWECNMSVGEIARVQGIELATVKAQIRRARQMIRLAFETDRIQT